MRLSLCMSTAVGEKFTRGLMWNRHKHHKEKDTVSSAFAATVLFWFGLFGLCVCVGFFFFLVVAVVFIIFALIYYLFQEMNEKNKDSLAESGCVRCIKMDLGKRGRGTLRMPEKGLQDGTILFLYISIYFGCATHGLFSLSMWDLVPWLGTESGSPAMGAWSLSHWTTRDTPRILL